MRYVQLIIIALLCVSFAQAAINDDLFAYYTLDEDGINSVNGSFTATYNGGAASFTGYIENGTNQTSNGEYMSIANGAHFNNFMTGDFTISFWVNPTSIAQSNSMFSLGGSGLKLIIDFDTSSNIRVNDGSSWYAFGAGYMNTGDWQHIVLTYNDSGSNPMKLYYNGSIVDTDTVSAEIVADTTAYLGNRVGSTNSEYQGLYDEIGFWNRTLNGDDVSTMYTNYLAGIRPISVSNALNIFAKNFYSGSGINNFNVTFTNGSFFSTTTGNITLINWTNGNYTLTIRSADYITESKNVEHINTSTTTFELFPSNQLLGQFLNEPDLQYVNNVSYSIISDVYSGLFNTTNGTFSLSGLPEGVFEIRYGLTQEGLQGSDFYTQRSFLFQIPLNDSTIANLSLILLNESLASGFIRTVVDENALPLANSFLEIQRFYPELGTYLAVERANIDSQGDAVFTAIPTTSSQSQAYRYRVFTNYNLIWTAPTPIYLVDTEKQLEVSLDENLLDNFNTWNDITYTLVRYNETHPTTPNSFELSYSDTSLRGIEYCLNITGVYITNVTYNSTCSTANAASLVVGYNNETNATWTAIGYVDLGNVTYPFTDPTTYKPGVDIGAIALGLFAVFIFILTILVGLGITVKSQNPVPLIFLTIGATVALSPIFLGWLQVSAVASGSVFLLGLIVLALYGGGR